MKKGTLKIVERLLEDTNSDIAIEELYKLFGYNNNSLINVLFLYVDSVIYENINIKRINDIEKCLDTVEKIVYEQDISLKLLNKRINKTVCKIDNLQIDKKQSSKKTKNISQRLHKLVHRLYNIEDLAKKNNSYECIRVLIEGVKDPNYLDNIDFLYNKSLSIKKYEGGTLIYSIIKEIIDEVLNNKCNEENIAYYKKVIYVIKNNKKFKLEEKEKGMCLEKLEEVIERLNVEEDNIKAKKDLLIGLRNIISNLALEENNIRQLTEYYNIHYNFSDDVLNSIPRKRVDIGKNYGDRVLVDDYIITLDSKDAYEIDDGLSIKRLKNGNYLLGVHIASPLSYFEYSSEVIKEAINRSNTIYFDKKVKIDYKKETNIIPMMPLNYTLNYMSLNKNNYVFAKSFYFELDNEANVVSQNYFKSIIKANKNCTFNDVGKMDTDDGEFKRTLSLLTEVAQKIEQKSFCEDIYLDIKSNSYNPSRTKVGNTIGEKIVNNIMVFTGNNVANYFYDNSYPLLYRTHSVDRMEIDNLENKLKTLGNYHDKEKFNKLYKSLVDTYPKARYDISGGHDGLGLAHYCHCTSPLRRAADIVVEHALNTCYFNRPEDKDLYLLEKEIKNARDIINKKNHDINCYLEEIDKQYSKKSVNKRSFIKK